MPSLDEREMFTTKSCANCQHCVVLIKANVLEGGYMLSDDVRFCAIDGVLSNDDQKFICMEVDKLMQQHTFTTDSERLIQLLQLENTDLKYCRSPRYVTNQDCCQFYEQRNWKALKDEE